MGEKGGEGGGKGNGVEGGGDRLKPEKPRGDPDARPSNACAVLPSAPKGPPACRSPRPGLFFPFRVLHHRCKHQPAARSCGDRETERLREWEARLSTSVRAVPEEGPPGVELKGAEQPSRPPHLACSSPQLC